MVYVTLLVSALLGIGGRSHEVFESNWITWYLRTIWVGIRPREETLSFQQVNPVEPVIAPALPYFEIWWKLSHDLQSLGITVVEHFHSVFVFGCLTQSLQHFKEDRYVVAFCYSVTIGINLKSPSKPIENQRFTINHLMCMSNPCEISDYKGGAFIVWH